MKKIYFLSILILGSLLLNAQWTEVSIGNSQAGISVLYSNNIVSGDESILAGTAGDGIWRSTDNGGSWTDISSNIGNKNINFLFGAETIFFAGTQDGAFLTVDLSEWIDNTGTGLASTDVSFYGIGSSVTGDHVYAIGTRNNGLFTSDEMGGPWADANNGISGEGLKVNHLSGYYDLETVTYNVLSTKGGVYFSLDGMQSWTQKNNGLAGDALDVTSALSLGEAVVIATHAGLYYTMNMGDSWITLLPDVKINQLLMVNRNEGPAFFLFGDSNLYSADLMTWSPVMMGGYTGAEVAYAAINSDYIFIAPAVDARSTASGGTLFKAPYAMVVGVGEKEIQPVAELSQNAPNPFSNRTSISFTLEHNGHVMLDVYDLTGRKLVGLMDEFRLKGMYTEHFDAGHLPEGVYYYQLSVTGQIVGTRKMVVSRK